MVKDLVVRRARRKKLMLRKIAKLGNEKALHESNYGQGERLFLLLFIFSNGVWSSGP